MIKKKKKIILIILILAASFTLMLVSAEARVRVSVINRLGDGRKMQIHCRSSDDDLGLQKVDDGCGTAWSFAVNFWGTTLFYCDVKWEDHRGSESGGGWKHFDAYDAQKDFRRCSSECKWMISSDGSLYGFDQEWGTWDRYPFAGSDNI
ncbi:self-incompatibility protein S1-like [Diospyros lotus]|uniref:self-incompatibility protein S1-like n=1 Tax=Diospyros lotus TaxID=55363 RepID=UPI0022569B4F|nr:self-incompatibility protein S1-like [Diospyros lotus]